MIIKNIAIEDNLFSIDDRLEIQNLISSLDSKNLTLETLWDLMDKVWDEMGCNNRCLDVDKLKIYYQHPVWLLNGLFIEKDPVSLQQRDSIAQWIAEHHLAYTVDYGGGFGTLARKIAQHSPNTRVEIYEPHPTELALSYCQSFSNIHFVDRLQTNYDCLVCTDVLEHVPDPLKVLYQMVAAVQVGGYLIIANHFYPSIQCHLPSTFHLRYTFDSFTKVMGLEKVGPCVGSHATIYQKLREPSFNWVKLRLMEVISKARFRWYSSSLNSIWIQIKQKLSLLKRRLKSILMLNE